MLVKQLAQHTLIVLHYLQPGEISLRLRVDASLSSFIILEESGEGSDTMPGPGRLRFKVVLGDIHILSNNIQDWNYCDYCHIY